MGLEFSKPYSFKVLGGLKATLCMEALLLNGEQNLFFIGEILLFSGEAFLLTSFAGDSNHLSLAIFTYRLASDQAMHDQAPQLWPEHLRRQCRRLDDELVWKLVPAMPGFVAYDVIKFCRTSGVWKKRKREAEDLGTMQIFLHNVYFWVMLCWV